MRKERWRGLSPAGTLAMLALLLLFAAGIWVYKHSGGGGSSFDVAAYLPGSSRLAVMVNLQGQLDPETVRGFADALLANLPPEERKTFEESVRSELGVPWTELGRFFDGRGATAVTLQENKAGAVMLVGLRDATALEALVKPRIPKDTRTEVVRGVTFYVGDAGQYSGLDQNWLYVGDSKASVEMLLASAGGKDTLAAQPSFAEARDKVQGSGSLVCAYWDIASTVKALQSVQPPYTDQKTFQELACFGWGVASLDYKGRATEAFVKIQGQGSSLGAKLLTSGTVGPATFSGLTDKAHLALAVDAEWVFNAALGFASLVPEAREYVAMVPMGYVFTGNPWSCFQGDIAVTADFMTSLSPEVTAAVQAARAGNPPPGPSGLADAVPSVAFCAPVSDAALLHGLMLKHSLAEGAAPKAGEARDYAMPGGTLKLTGGTPPLMLLGLGPNAAPLFEVDEGSLAESSALRELLAWGGQSVIYADYLDVRPLLEVLKKAIPEEPTPENERLRDVLQRIPERDMVGASCVAVRPDGLHMRSSGLTGGGLLVTMGVGTLIGIPYAAGALGVTLPFDPGAASTPAVSAPLLPLPTATP